MTVYLSGGVSRDSGVGVVVGVEQGVVELTLGVYPYKMAIKQSIQTKYFEQERLKLEVVIKTVNKTINNFKKHDHQYGGKKCLVNKFFINYFLNTITPVN